MIAYSVVDVQQSTIHQWGTKVASKNEVKDLIKGESFEWVRKHVDFLVSNFLKKKKSTQVHQSSQNVENDGVTELSIFFQHGFVSVSFKGFGSGAIFFGS